MSDDLFDIYFAGKVINADELETVKQKVAKLFNANESVLAKLFSGTPVKIKKAVDMDTAIKYRVKFREAGAVVDIRPAKSVADAIPKPATFAIDDSGDASNERAPATAENPIPEKTIPPKPIQEQPQSPASLNAGLAMTGAFIDDTPPPPPANISTDGLSAAEPNSGSLEEFAEMVVAAPLPDISQLDIEQTDAPLDSSPLPEALEIDLGDMAIDVFSGDLDQTPPPAPANISTDSLSVSAPNSGSLEEFDSRPEPVPVPDTSKLDLA